MSYTHEEIYQRRCWVADKVASGWVRGLIEHQWLKRWPDLSKSTFMSDYRTAMGDFRESTKKEREELLSEAICMRHKLIRDALDDGDTRLALEAQKDLSKLLGLYERDNGQRSATVEINLGDPDMESVEEAELEVLEELRHGV